MNFRKSISKLLMLTILTWSAHSYSDGYADIGYKDGLLMQVNMKVSGPFYIRAGLGRDVASYGIGSGWNNTYFRVMGTIDRTASDEFEYGVDATYYDRTLSWFAAVNYNSSKAKLGYKIGLGYTLNTNVSMITYYSDNGAFVGFRRWFN